MGDIAEIKIQKGTETLPTILRIRFNPMPWNFAFNQNRMERWMGSEEDCQRYEVKEAVLKCLNLIRQELFAAVSNQLEIHL